MINQTQNESVETCEEQHGALLGNVHVHGIVILFLKTVSLSLV